MEDRTYADRMYHVYRRFFLGYVTLGIMAIVWADVIARSSASTTGARTAVFQVLGFAAFWIVASWGLLHFAWYQHVAQFSAQKASAWRVYLTVGTRHLLLAVALWICADLLTRTGFPSVGNVVYNYLIGWVVCTILSIALTFFFLLLEIAH